MSPIALLLLVTSIATPAHAGPTDDSASTAPALGGASSAQLPFRARLRAPDAAGRGMVTIDADTLEIEVKRAFSREAHAFAFGDARAVHLRRGAFHTDILLDMRDGAEIRVRTRPREYESLKAALKGRISAR